VLRPGGGAAQPVRAQQLLRDVSTPAHSRAGVRLDRLENLLRSAAAFPPVALHKERTDLEVCSIGRVLFVSDGKAFVQEIRPDATWKADPDSHRLGDITRISLGGRL
jgi:hypothetical protein